MKFSLMTLAWAARVFASPMDIEARARTFPEPQEPDIRKIMTYHLIHMQWEKEMSCVVVLANPLPLSLRVLVPSRCSCLLLLLSKQDA